MDPIDRTRVPLDTSLLAIDPGLNGTGWALWIAPRPIRQLRTAPARVGVLRKKHDTFVANTNWLCYELHKVMNTGRIGPLIVTCEFPEYQTGATRAMGWMRGDLQKLTYLVGAMGHLTHQEGAVFEPVPVSQWKGQLPKDVVIDRIQQTLGSKSCIALGIKTHAWDAVGIGLWRLGVFS